MKCRFFVYCENVSVSVEEVVVVRVYALVIVDKLFEFILAYDARLVEASSFSSNTAFSSYILF